MFHLGKQKGLSVEYGHTFLMFLEKYLIRYWNCLSIQNCSRDYVLELRMTRVDIICAGGPFYTLIAQVLGKVYVGFSLYNIRVYLAMSF